LRQAELAEAIGLGAAAIGKLVDALEASGWLERRPDPTDRRAKHLHLTRRARHVLATTRERFELLHSELENALDPTLLGTLLSRLGWIRHRLLEEITHTADARRAGAR
jgi:DNA-binding MarR family transcriptional regulator